MEPRSHHSPYSSPFLHHTRGPLISTSSHRSESHCIALHSLSRPSPPLGPPWNSHFSHRSANSAMATSLHLSLAAAAPASSSALRSATSFVGAVGRVVCPSAAPRRLHHRRRHGSLVVEAKIREIFMPALSSTMTEGKIVSWVKNEGDRLSKGTRFSLLGLLH